MTVWAAIKAYNSEKHGLKKCLESLEGVDNVLVADGRFPDSAWGTTDPKQLEYYHKRYPPGNRSTDHSEWIARSRGNVYWLEAPEQPYESETDKMNQMLKYIPDNDWVLLIDPDEVLVGNIRGVFPPIPCDVIMMRVVDKEGHSLYYSRLFKKKKGVSFASHHSLHIENADVELYNGQAPENFFIRHERIEII